MLDVSIDRTGRVPRLLFRSKFEPVGDAIPTPEQKRALETQQYDREAMTYLSWVLYPLVAGNYMLRMAARIDVMHTHVCIDAMTCSYHMDAMSCSCTHAMLSGYAIYSLYYEDHKSWYSWVLGSLTGCVYTFG